MEPEFEEEPAEELLPYTDSLALRTVSLPRWSNDPRDPWVPWGAGLCVKRAVAEEHLRKVRGSDVSAMLDRKGTELNSCGDDEFSWTACAMGLGRGIFPELRVTHLIDRRRVQCEYLLRIAEGHAYSHAILNYIHGCPTQAPDREPSCLLVLHAIAAISPSRFFYEAQRWWSNRSRPAIERDFSRARSRGVMRALEFIAKQATWI